MSNYRKNIDFKEIIRYAIVGLVATAIHYGVYLLCQLVMSPNVAYTIGWIVSLTVNMFLTAHFTFRSSITLWRAGGFIASHVVNYLLHISLFNFFLWCGVGQKWAPLCVFCIVIPVNFILVRFVFKKMP